KPTMPQPWFTSFDDSSLIKIAIPESDGASHPPRHTSTCKLISGDQKDIVIKKLTPYLILIYSIILQIRVTNAFSNKDAPLRRADTSSWCRLRSLDVSVGELRVQQLQTELTTLVGFSVLVTFNYESSGASAPVPTSTQERLGGLTCEERGNCCKSKAGLVAHHRVHDNESVALRAIGCDVDFFVHQPMIISYRGICFPQSAKAVIGLGLPKITVNDLCLLAAMDALRTYDTFMHDTSMHQKLRKGIILSVVHLLTTRALCSFRQVTGLKLEMAPVGACVTRLEGHAQSDANNITFGYIALTSTFVIVRLKVMRFQPTKCFRGKLPIQMIKPTCSSSNRKLGKRFPCRNSSKTFDLPGISPFASPTVQRERPDVWRWSQHITHELVTSESILVNIQSVVGYEIAGEMGVIEMDWWFWRNDLVMERTGYVCELSEYIDENTDIPILDPKNFFGQHTAEQSGGLSGGRKIPASSVMVPYLLETSHVIDKQHAFDVIEGTSEPITVSTIQTTIGRIDDYNPISPPVTLLPKGNYETSGLELVYGKAALTNTSDIDLTNSMPRLTDQRTSLHI
ncbi:hypothetical protein CLF_105081, partial [Clonorchis sinensis]